MSVYDKIISDVLIADTLDSKKKGLSYVRGFMANLLAHRCDASSAPKAI